MATTVDELIVEIKADIKDVTRGLNNVKRQLNQTDKSSVTLQRSMQALGRVIAAVGAASVARNIIRVGDSFEQLRISLSTMFGGAAAGEDALQRINTFAQTTPFQLEDVTKAFISLKAQGIEPSEQVLAAFGDAASATLTPLESFNSLVRMLGRSTQGALGLEDLNQLADRGIPVFKILEERIGKTRDEVTEFGKTAEGAAKIMEELTKGLEESFGGLMEAQMDTFGVKVSNLAINFKRLADEIFRAGTGGILKDLTDDLANLVGSGVEFFRVRREGRDVPSFIMDMVNGGEEGAARAALRQEIDGIALDLAELSRQRMSRDALLQTAGIFGPLAEIGAQMSGALPDFFSQGTRSLDSYDTEINALLQTLQRFHAFKESLGQNEATVTSGTGPSQAEIDALQAMRGLLEDTVTPLEEINLLFDQLNMVIDSGIGDFTTDELVALMNHLDELRAEVTETADTFTDVMAPAIAEAAQTFTSDFVNSLMEGQSALSSFKDFAKDIVSQIVTTFLQMAVVNRILKAVFGSTGLGVAGFDDLPVLAGGGNVSRGQPYLVGERGPELFMPNTGGRIVNNADTKSAMSGGQPVVVNQTINLSAGVVGTVRSEVQRMLPEIANVAKLGVLEASRRGGSYRKGLLGT